jgi:hypothetical protein
LQQPQDGGQSGSGKFWDWLQTGLDIVGLIPAVGEIADGCNALISLGRGDTTGALLSAGAMIPFAGWAAGGAKLGRRAARFISNATVVSKGKVIGIGTVDIGPTLDRIGKGLPYPHPNDGTIFKNRKTPLPPKPDGYYTEYVHPTPGVSGPGSQRIVTGKCGEIYYTPDHYGTFIRVN